MAWSNIILIITPFCCVSALSCIDKAPLLVQVELALNILDGAPFREDPKQVIHVQRAKFEQKGHDYVPKKKPKSKKKVAGVLSKQEKELGWGGFDDKLAANKVSFAQLCLVHQLAHTTSAFAYGVCVVAVTLIRFMTTQLVCLSWDR